MFLDIALLKKLSTGSTYGGLKSRKAIIVALILLLFFFQDSSAQQKPHGFPPPHNGPKHKKDTTRPNPYLVDTLLAPIPFYHSYIHDKIDKELAKADLADGHADSVISIVGDTALTISMTRSFFDTIPRCEVLAENLPIAGGRDSVMENQQKLRVLTALWELLRKYNNDPKPDALYYINLVDNMKSMIVAANENKLLDFAKMNPNIYTLDNGKVMMEGQHDARQFIYTYIGLQDPAMMVRRLAEFASDSFAGVIIKADARIEPELIFNYATSTNKAIRSAIQQTHDTLVQDIEAIASRSAMPLKALPFLSDLYYGRLSIPAIDSINRDPVSNYRNLCRLTMQGDSIGRYSYTRDLEFRVLQLVRKMNELHESPDNERFRCIDSLQPQDLYLLMVLGQDEIYTSTYLGTFHRLLDRMKPKTGNWLLDTMRYDRFRTFVRMAAGYDMLAPFLATMDDTIRNGVMSRFVDGLEKGPSADLEDAVDVADAFGSIRDSALSALLEERVKLDYEASYKARSKKGLIIYSLLARLFAGDHISDNDTGATVAARSLHLPSINKVLFSDLVSDSGIVYQQVFFFGDEDGNKSYRTYLEEFADSKTWAIDSTGNYWTTIYSLSGRKIVIYANKPLDEPDDEDAQTRLCKFLADSGIRPRIMIHRGHSYHLPQTISKLTPDVRIVILGSCGGFHNLSLVLGRAPDAHIVSSKQTGTGAVNDPILVSLNKHLLAGEDVNWITIWTELEDYFATRPELRERFSDYVPPHKNLGAIFIKAYRALENESTHTIK